MQYEKRGKYIKGKEACLRATPLGFRRLGSSAFGRSAIGPRARNGRRYTRACKRGLARLRLLPPQFARRSCLERGNSKRAELSLRCAVGSTSIRGGADRRSPRRKRKSKIPTRLGSGGENSCQTGRAMPYACLGKR